MCSLSLPHCLQQAKCFPLPLDENPDSSLNSGPYLSSPASLPSFSGYRSLLCVCLLPVMPICSCIRSFILSVPPACWFLKPGSLIFPFLLPFPLPPFPCSPKQLTFFFFWGIISYINKIISVHTSVNFHTHTHTYTYIYLSLIYIYRYKAFPGTLVLLPVNICPLSSRYKSILSSVTTGQLCLLLNFI